MTDTVKVRIALPPLLMDEIEDCVAFGLHRDTDDFVLDAIRCALRDCRLDAPELMKQMYPEYMRLRNLREDAEVVEMDIPRSMRNDILSTGNVTGLGINEFSGIAVMLLSERMGEYAETRE